MFMKEENENWDFIFQRHHKMNTKIFYSKTLWIMNDWYTTLTHHVSCKEKNNKCELCGKVCCTKNTYLTLVTPTAANFFNLVIDLWSGVNLLREFLGKSY